MEKVREAEDEIMSAYRVADTLGITVDSHYNIGEGNEFDICGAAEAVRKLCLSEAAERHIELRTEYPSHPVRMWGDEKASQSAITQLLMNAIKHAFGSSYVTLTISDYLERVQVSLTDVGTPLDHGEVQHMWEFGFRGRRALELRVNGSGIGLFTVKKVVEAHGGKVMARSGKESDNFVVVSFSIPKRDLLDKSILLRGPALPHPGEPRGPRPYSMRAIRSVAADVADRLQQRPRIRNGRRMADVRRSRGAKRVDALERLSEHIFIEKQDGVERLVLAAGRDVTMANQVGQKPFHLFLAGQGSGIPRKGSHVASQPIDVGLFR